MLKINSGPGPSITRSTFYSRAIQLDTKATFMFGAIISGEVGIAEQSATGGKIGIVESAA